MGHHQEDCSNGGCIKIDHPDRKAEYKKKTACSKFVAEDVNKKADDFIKNFKEQLKNTVGRQFVAEDVNKKADDFIKNFRKQLKFEREESLKRYRETRDRRMKGTSPCMARNRKE